MPNRYQNRNKEVNVVTPWGARHVGSQGHVRLPHYSPVEPLPDAYIPEKCKNLKKDTHVRITQWGGGGVKGREREKTSLLRVETGMATLENHLVPIEDVPKQWTSDFTPRCICTKFLSAATEDMIMSKKHTL